MFWELRQPHGDPEVLAAESREQYYKVPSYSLDNHPFTVWLLVLRFGAGLMGSLAYMRMLGNTVDAMADGARGVMKKGAAAQPRLLVPVVLVMIVNRWKAILVPEYGFMHLELIPMLVGFLQNIYILSSYRRSRLHFLLNKSIKRCNCTKLQFI
ncbi:ATP synthase protein I -related [Raphanus sativus]|nr:ATP synthase protein I -related [Raphanus sativus]